jgi:vacuolar-type H+-ATPase subunit I/STV1
MSTKFLARLMGFWIVLTVVGMMVTPAASLQAITRLFSDPALMWITGVFTLLIGLAVVLTHNRWSGGAVPVLVTLYGWIALVKGLLFIWLPAEVQPHPSPRCTSSGTSTST